MKWTITTPATTTPVDYGQLSSHLRLVGDRDRADVLGMIDAATAHAEQAMGCSLVNRTITATYYQDEASILLPRGPVVSISSVTDGNGNHPTFELRGFGNVDQLVITTAYAWPVTIVYVAGFGPNADDVPADVRQAIKMHAATLYLNRVSVSEKTMVPVPQTLEAFYRLRSRNTGMA